MIGNLNRRINIKSWGSTQDEGGGAISVIVASYDMWAEVQARSGTPFTGEQQQVWNYDYKVIFRYERSRIVKSNQTIDYDGKRLAINSISYEEEGNKKYCVCRCSTRDGVIDTSKDALLTLQTFDYYGIDHEDNFTADGTTMAAPNVAKDLRNKIIVGAFKDGIEYAVLYGGIPNPLAKEVVYNSVTGNFLWSHAYEPGEHTLIQYI